MGEEKQGGIDVAKAPFVFTVTNVYPSGKRQTRMSNEPAAIKKMPHDVEEKFIDVLASMISSRIENGCTSETA